MRLRKIRILLWILVGVVAIIGGGFQLSRQWAPESPSPVYEAAGTAVRTDFNLVDHTGKITTDKDFRGKWSLIFFGYTNGPVVCPTTLNDISMAMDALGADGEQVQPLFVTVDPERDTPEAMAKFLTAFDTRIVGLTGSSAQIEYVTQGFKVYFAKAAQEDAPDGYIMNHAAYIYLINPDGEFEAVFTYADGVDGITNGIRTYL